MKIRRKIILFLGVSVILFFMVIVPYIYLQTERNRTNLITDNLKHFNSQLNTLLNDKKDVWLTNALQIAYNPLISDALYNNNREKCIELLNGYSEEYKKHTNFKNVNIHIIDKNLNSFVKSWSADSYGESLNYSKAYREVLSTKKPIVAMEYSPKGLRLKGLFPVYKNNEIIGLANFEGGLNSIKRVLDTEDIEFLYLLDNKFLSVAKSLNGQPEIGDYVLSQKDVNNDFLNYAGNYLNVNSAIKNYYFDNKYLTTAIPIYSFNGDQIGLFLLAKEAHMVTSQIEEVKRNLIILSAFFSVMFLIIMFFLLAFIEKSIIRPIKNTVNSLVDIAEGDGDLTKRLEVKSKDEIGQLSKYFNLTMEKISQLIASISAQSNILSSVGESLATNMQETSASITQISANIQSVKNQSNNQFKSVILTNTILENVTQSITVLNDQVEQQSNNVTETSSSIEEMMANINSVTQTLASNSSNINKLTEASKSGSLGITQMSEEIDDVAKESEGLFEISNMIQNIASQTNLLAMNAAIEAAHAGESGKGFAVVADEVRKLAESSIIQAKTVSEVLKKIKNSVDKIADSTSSVLSKFIVIDSGVKIVSEQEGAIRNAMEEQSEGSQLILRAINNLSEITQQVKSSSSEILEGSSQVITESSNLNRLTQEVTNSINEMSQGADQIVIAVDAVNELAVSNKDSNDILEIEVSKFKV